MIVGILLIVGLMFIIYGLYLIVTRIREMKWLKFEADCEDNILRMIIRSNWLYQMGLVETSMYINSSINW